MASITYAEDPKKLEKRLEAHRKYSENDLNSWITSIIDLKYGESLLDIGCGSGGLLKEFATKFNLSFFVGLDKTKDHDDIAKKFNNIHIIIGDMDTAEIPFMFDVVMANFSLYYSKNIPMAVDKIYKILKPTGRLFVCGPTKGNNKELLAVQSTITNTDYAKQTLIMPEQILPELKFRFNHITEYHFTNPIHFPDMDPLMEYWRSYYTYQKNIEKQFKTIMQKHFQKYNQFTTTKQILGILAKKT